MELTAKQTEIIRAFWNKERTVRDVADELDISYNVCVREVQVLVREGHLKEMAFRKGKQRYLTAVAIPGLTDLPVELTLMPWGGKLQTIAQALMSFSPSKETSHRYRIMTLLAALEYNGLQLAEGTDSGWKAKDVRMAMRKIQSELNLWQEFIKALLDLPIWFDDPNAASKISTGFNEEQRMQLALEVERHFMASGKRALEE